MKPILLRWGGLVAGVTILIVLIWQVGTGPFLNAFAVIGPRGVTAVAVITLLTTLCCAWRWKLVASGLGSELRLGAAVSAYYRSQLLNSVLPGGVLGDVHRGFSHGRSSGDISRGLRAVAWERSSGQIVQTALAVLVLVWLPSPIRPWALTIAAIILAVLGVFLGLARLRVPNGTSSWSRFARMCADDLRGGFLSGRRLPRIIGSSAGATAGHVLIFLIAVRTVGAGESIIRMLPIALLVLLAMSAPVSIAGWGPREGASAIAFSAYGLSAEQGVTVAVVYGLLTLISYLPGGLVLILGGLRGRPLPVGPTRTGR